MTVRIASAAQNFEDNWKPRLLKQNEIVPLPFRCAEEWRLRKLALQKTVRSLKHTRYLQLTAWQSTEFFAGDPNRL
jgi:hypothetical protein